MQVKNNGYLIGDVAENEVTTPSREFLIKQKGNRGYVYLGYVWFPVALVGKKVRVVVEGVTDDE